MRCGLRLLQSYERRKRSANVLDFTDIEWYADRLLRDEGTAAYMQANLDARYRHLLVDEFQDTSTLQWRALQCWLALVAKVGFAYCDQVDWERCTLRMD